jgi:hypothetical protein
VRIAEKLPQEYAPSSTVVDGAVGRDWAPKIDPRLADVQKAIELANRPPEKWTGAYHVPDNDIENLEGMADSGPGAGSGSAQTWSQQRAERVQEQMDALSSGTEDGSSSSSGSRNSGKPRPKYPRVIASGSIKSLYGNEFRPDSAFDQNTVTGWVANCGMSRLLVGEGIKPEEVEGVVGTGETSVTSTGKTIIRGGNSQGGSTTLNDLNAAAANAGDDAYDPTIHNIMPDSIAVNWNDLLSPLAMGHHQGATDTFGQVL